MKKVSILSLHLGYGGIEKCVCALANMLCDKYEVEIACTYKLYDKPAFFLDNRVNIKYLTDVKPNKEKIKNSLHKKKIFTFVKEAFYAIKVLYKRKYTMINYIKNCDSKIIIATRDIFDLWLSFYAKPGTLKIGWEHNHYHENFKYANSIINANKNNDYLVLVSKSLKDFYANELRGRCKCIYIPNVIEFIPLTKSSLKEKRLITVGRLSKEKGQIDLINMFIKIHNKHNDWKLDIIGEGDEREALTNLIVSNNLESCVILHGFKNKDFIDSMLDNSSLFLLTSFTESFGIVLIEAMSHGVPCIAFDSAEGARDLIDSGSNGFLIKNRNQKAYIKKVNDLIENYDDRVKLGNVARKSVKAYTSDIVKEDWFKLLEGR